MRTINFWLQAFYTENWKQSNNFQVFGEKSFDFFFLAASYV